MNFYRVLLSALASLLLISCPTEKAGEIVTRAMQFAKGHSSATIEDTVKGDQTINYILHARAGLHMSVNLKTSKGANYFNVLPPGSNAKVEDTPYHATGPLPCTMGNDQPVQCEFGVIRGKLDNGEVHIPPPGGLKLILTFMGDTVTTNPGERITAEKKDEWLVEVNDYEYYRIPEAVIFGG